MDNAYILMAEGLSALNITMATTDRYDALLQLIRPNKINVLFPVTCWEKEGRTVGKIFYFKEIFYNLSETKTNSHNFEFT